MSYIKKGISIQAIIFKLKNMEGLVRHEGLVPRKERK
jgi:hypothetical protein